MASNPFSASLQAQPTYTFGPSTSFVNPPSFKLPDMPTLAPIDESRAPNSTFRQWLRQQFENLPGKYNPALQGVKTSAQHALAGYGGWEWQDDDPATTDVDESLAAPIKDPHASLGARENQAVAAQRAAANARGMLDSSFANKAVGAALGQLNEEAKAIVAQYASGISGIISQQQGEGNSIIGDLVRYYGQDAQYLAENPPPTPPEPEPEPEPAAAPNPNAVAPGAAAPSLSGTVTWKKKPNYTPAQIENRFGPGARLVQGKSGYYYVLLPNGGGMATRGTGE